jgi:hypothetical protein
VFAYQRGANQDTETTGEQAAAGFANANMTAAESLSATEPRWPTLSWDAGMEPWPDSLCRVTQWALPKNKQVPALVLRR